MRMTIPFCLLAMIGCRPRPSAVAPATVPPPATAPAQADTASADDARAEADAPKVAELLRAIDADDGGVPREVYEEFWKIGPTGQRELLGAMTRKSHHLTIAALLCTVGTPTKDALPGLLRMLNDDDRRVARTAAETLDNMDHAGLLHVRPARLEMVLHDGRYDLPTYRVPYAVGTLGPKLRHVATGPATNAGDLSTKMALAEEREGVRVSVSVPYLLAAAASPDAALRLWALQDLVDIGQSARDEAAAALAKAAHDPEPKVRMAVPGLLARLRQHTEYEQEVGTSMSVPDLVAAAKSKNPWARAVALQGLADAGPLAASEAGTALEIGVKDPDPKVRKIAVELLARVKLDATKVVPTLIQMLDDPESSVRFGSVAALKTIGRAAEPAIPALVKCIEKDTDASAALAADTLLALGQPAVAPLLAAFRDAESGDLQARKRLLLILPRLGPEARAVRPLLSRAIVDRNDPLRLEMIEALPQYGLDDPTVPPALAAIIADPTDPLRGPAAELLLGDEPAALAALPQLAIVLKRNGDGLRGAVLRILEVLGPKAQPLLPDLLAVLKDRADPLRLDAARVIGAIDPGNGEVIPALMRMLQEGTFTDGAIPDAAAQALARMGSRAKEQLPALAKMLASPKSADQRRALDVLEALGPEARPALAALAAATTDPNPVIHRRATLLLLRLQPDGDAADAAVLEAVRRHDYATISLRARDATRRRGAALRAALADLAAHSPDVRVSADARIALADLRAAE